MNIVKLFILPALLVLLTLDPTVSTAEKKKVIFLTQIPCMFIESEKEIQNYTSKSPADCERINEKTMNDRKLTNLTLKQAHIHSASPTKASPTNSASGYEARALNAPPCQASQAAAL